MKLTGSRLALCALLLMLSGALQAAFDVSVDRNNLALGDSVRLVISSSGSDDLNKLDFRLLLADFEILQRSSTSSTNIINGRRSRTLQLTLDLLPRREGTAYIPAFSTDAGSSEPIRVEVGPTPTLDDGDQSVLFEAEVDRTEVYVQGQILLTLRIQQAINLDNRSISDLQLANAFAKPLEQRSFQRTVNGKPWLVHEVRYAVFPEQSGTLEIPMQIFTARESQARGRGFDFGSSGRQLQRRSEPLRITVKPRPDTFPNGDTWLPARNLSLEESWSTTPDQLQAGESVTRTITLRGEGLQGAQLPPVEFTQVSGLKYYPDQPLVEDREDDAGLVGLRQDSAALVATGAGSLTLPELRIPWWDTQADTLRYAVLPARQISISGAVGAPVGGGVETRSGAIPLPIATVGDTAGALLWPWQLLALLCALGWAATLIWYRPQSSAAASAAKPPENRTAGSAFKQLQAACASNSAPQARRALLAWGRARVAPAQCESLATLTAALGDPDLSAAATQLDQALYGDSATPWEGAALLAAVSRQQRSSNPSAADNQVLDLYPRGAR